MRKTMSIFNMMGSLPDGHPLKVALQEAKDIIDELDHYGDKLHDDYNKLINKHYGGVGGFHDLALDEDEYGGAVHAYNEIMMEAAKWLNLFENADLEAQVYQALSDGMAHRAKTCREVDIKKNEIEKKLNARMSEGDKHS